MKFKFEVADLIKLPNLLCYLRILMVPLFLILFFGANETSDNYYAAGVVVLSGVTDFLDGQIARRYNMVTDFGKIIDPIADKLMQLAMLVALTYNIQYMFILVIILVIKEVTMAVIGFVIMKRKQKRLNGAKWYGKICTALLYVVMLAFVAFPDLPLQLQIILMLICGFALIFTLVMYILIYVTMIRDCNCGNNEKQLY